MEPLQASPRPRRNVTRLFRLSVRFFAGRAVEESTSTRARFKASPEEIWTHLMLYEEVPRNPPFLLRTFLPMPVRTEGRKAPVGATVRCSYREGMLVKRITRIEPPRLLQFEVMEQSLGIEECALALGGAYDIHAAANATEVELTTNYRSYLRPRIVWQRLEALFLHQLHNHILDGLRLAIGDHKREVAVRVRQAFTPQTASQHGSACSTSKSPSRHC